MTAPRVPVEGLEHVGIAVQDIDEALETFERLGFVRRWVEDLPEQGLRSHVVEAGRVQLELLEVVDRESALARFLDSRGEGLHHLCLRVGSLEATVEELQAQGMRVTEPSEDQRGRRVFVHPSSAAGVLVGLVEPWS